ncbi:Ribosomal RNA small subunit methyltransferase I [compost metagenome]
MSAGKLFLIPNTLGGESTEDIIPQKVAETASELRVFAVEDVKSARRLLRKIDRTFPIDESEFFILNKSTNASELYHLIKAMKAGKNVGIISEAGCAGIADPGGVLVALAHENNIQVCPTVGPSSILLTLIGSGFNGQQFSFHGYLPKDKKERIRKLKDLEQRVKRSGETQLFMDTPFRTMHVFEDALNELADDTLLCVGSNLTLFTERIQTMSIKDWRENAFDISKQPVMFALGKI